MVHDRNARIVIPDTSDLVQLSCDDVGLSLSRVKQCRDRGDFDFDVVFRNAACNSEHEHTLRVRAPVGMTINGCSLGISFSRNDYSFYTESDTIAVLTFDTLPLGESVEVQLSLDYRAASKAS